MQNVIYNKCLLIYDFKCGSSLSKSSRHRSAGEVLRIASNLASVLDVSSLRASIFSVMLVRSKQN